MSAMTVRMLLAGAAVAALAACATHVSRWAPVLTPETDPDVQEALAHPAGAGKPVKVHHVTPRHPGGLIARGVRLTAELETVIARDGTVKVYAVRRSDDPDFTWECVRAVSQWRYQPLQAADGTPVSVRNPASCSITTR